MKSDESVEEKRRQLAELKQRLYQHQQSLQSIAAKFPEFRPTSPVFVRKLADNMGTSLRFPDGFENSLLNLEGWEYCWLTLLVPDSAGSIGKLQLTIDENKGLNFHAYAVKAIYGNEAFPFVEPYPLENGERYALYLVLRRIERIDGLSLQLDYRIPDGIIIEFKVYHPRIESLSVLQGAAAQGTSENR